MANQNQKLMIGDQVTIGKRRRIYEIVNFNEKGNKVLVTDGQNKEWVYQDWIDLYKSATVIQKFINFIIGLFKKKA